jgi:uncharacterized membrane protein SirB2
VLYHAIKFAHVTFATLSLLGFLVRSRMTLVDSPYMRKRNLQVWIRVVPHLNDTLLLVFAVVLCVMSGQYPFVDSWVTAKVVALIGYIGMGMLALRPRGSRIARAACSLAAVAIFADIVVIAATKNPLGIASLLPG